MQYVFIDIEGANNYNFISKMCTFGYVVTNTNFEVKTKIDVIMNPESPFDKHIIRKKMNAYDLSVYQSRPPFSYFYKSIKNILENDNQLVIGWSIENDVRFIYDACKRYSLKQINYEYLDLQKVIIKLTNAPTAPSLEATCEKYKIETLKAHKSDDDAFLTMQIAKQICKENNATLEELYKNNKDCISNVNEFSKHILSKKEISERIKKRKVSYQISTIKRSKILTNPEIKENDIYSFSIDVILNHTDDLLRLIRYITNCGAKCSSDVSKCNKFICLDKKYKPHHNEVEMIDYYNFINKVYNYQK